MCYFVNTSYTWNRPHLCTHWLNDVKCTKFLFFIYLIVILKKKNIKRMFMCKIIIVMIIILICQKLGLVRPKQQKLSCLYLMQHFLFFSNFPQSFNLTEIYFCPNHIDQQKVLNYWLYLDDYQFLNDAMKPLKHI